MPRYHCDRCNGCCRLGFRPSIKILSGMSIHKIVTSTGMIWRMTDIREARRRIFFSALAQRSRQGRAQRRPERNRSAAPAFFPAEPLKIPTTPRLPDADDRKSKRTHPRGSSGWTLIRRRRSNYSSSSIATHDCSLITWRRKWDPEFGGNLRQIDVSSCVQSMPIASL